MGTRSVSPAHAHNHPASHAWLLMAMALASVVLAMGAVALAQSA